MQVLVYISKNQEKSLKLLSNIEINNRKRKQPREEEEVLLMLEWSWSKWLRETRGREEETPDATRPHQHTNGTFGPEPAAGGGRREAERQELKAAKNTREHSGEKTQALLEDQSHVVVTREVGLLSADVP